MGKRMDATITRYPKGGYCLDMPDGSQYESDTVKEAMSFAHAEGVTRVYSSARLGQFVILGREDSI